MRITPTSMPTNSGVLVSSVPALAGVGACLASDPARPRAKISGANRPITAALNDLTGEFFTNNNLISAAALIVAVPTLIVFFALQRQFVSGLTLGANKG